MGNIIVMLFLGHRIYLSKNNSILNFFKKNNLIVFSFEDDFKIYGTQPLEYEEIKRNRNIIKNLFSKGSLFYSLNKILEVN